MAFFAGDGPKTGTSPTLERKLCLETAGAEERDPAFVPREPAIWG